MQVEGIRWQCHSGPEANAKALAQQVAQWLREDLALSERVTLALSGGTTPVPFFQALSGEGLPWERVDLVPVDERWVPESHPASNAGSIRRHLLRGAAGKATLIPLYTPATCPEASEVAVNKALSGLAWPLSVAVMGMGPDGHTASWFLQAPELERALSPPPGLWACAQNPPGFTHGRMTLTAPVIAQARRRILHLTGEDKRNTLEQALAAPSTPMEVPVQCLFSAPLTIFWSPNERSL